MTLSENKDNMCKSILVFLSLFISTTLFAQKGRITGCITDGQTKEALFGVTVQVENSSIGAITDFEGKYIINGLSEGSYNLQISYISYETKKIKSIAVKAGQNAQINVSLMPADIKMKEVVVIGRKNLETEKALMIERQKATIAIENLGAKEMSVKGISNVADGVKKITGISIEGNNDQVFVRGLGDRYSTTSLNGLSIASPNPDNKLIPLSLFPTSVVKNITVNKVYQPSSFGDYAGAHIDIESKENIGTDYLTLSVTTGGKLNTLFSDFYSSDKGRIGNSYFGLMDGLKLSSSTKNMRSDDFKTYSVKNNPFKTSFSANKKQGVPELGVDLGMGKSWKIGEQKLNASVALNFKNDYTINENAYMSTLNAQGIIMDKFNYNKYTYATTSSAMAQLSYTLRKKDLLSYNMMYVRSTDDSYSDRDGIDPEGILLKGSNSIYHIYGLLNNQFAGKHFLKDKLLLTWQGSYGKTTSDEPDRRQVMFTKGENGLLSLFKLNQQETMRYFGELNENEWVGDVKLKYNFSNRHSENNFIHIGGAVKSKSRDYYSANFYYNIDGISPSVASIYNTDSYLNFTNIQNGSISIDKSSQPRNKYFAGNDVYAGFAEIEFSPINKLLAEVGVRYEHSEQYVRYWNDAAAEKRAKLNTDDLFPALNLKYTINKKRYLRLSASRTVTRPSFIEMAPFEYQESYGGEIVRGYADIKNGYNYNVDLRYEMFPVSGDMYSISAYYKYLDSPIERVQEYSGAAIQSFRNVNKGKVAGLEIEMKKKLAKDLKLDFNASYIYTRITLPEDGIYTDKSRQLQGASPYLVNADLNYSPKFSKEKSLSLSLVYNLQGPRIHTVGINNVNNVEEKTFNTLDFVGRYSINPHIQFKLQAKNLINQNHEFTQKIAGSGKDETVKFFKNGTSFDLGFTYIF